jgi:fatty acid desaturase
MTDTPTPVLSAEDLEAFGAEMDAIRDRVLAEVGEEDATYIRRVIKAQRALEAGGRGLLLFGLFPPAWVAGVTALSASKILDNMEIGHNVMHGQYDWMQDPALDSHEFEWDTACPGENWRHSHNYLHHTYTNVRGKDRDIGYGILRMTEEQEWKPTDLGNPAYALALAVLFQYGVMLHDLEVEKVISGKTAWADLAEARAAIKDKLGRQLLKDYVIFPLLSGPSLVPAFLGNATANLVRNLWSFTIIFCGHFPDGVATFSKESTEDESRGQWYLRQLLGSANITGGKLFHLMSGNLSHQIEHHLFPDLPARRYAQISGEVKDACERYGLPYNTGGLARQFGSVVKRIAQLALPGRADSNDVVEVVGGELKSATAAA